MAKDIYGYKCGKCGHINYPYRMRCKKCQKTEYTDFEPVPLPKKGKLLTFTRVYNLPPDFEVPRLGLGIVELDNGVRMLGQLDIPEPKMGMKVKGEVTVVRRLGYDVHFGMVFRCRA